MSPADLQDVIGAEHAATLAAFLRGRRLYVPKCIPPDHPISLLVGCRAAERLSAYWGGDAIDFGTGGRQKVAVRDDAIRRERWSGATVEELAERHGISVRQVYRALGTE